MKRFHKFCTQYNVSDPFPVTEHLLCCYSAYLAEEGLAPQSIKSYLAAVRSTQLSLGLPDPREQSSLPILKRVQAGISRLRASQGRPPKVRLPITAHLLQQIKATLHNTAHRERLVLWAVCCTAFFGFFRLGELLLGSASAFNPRLHLAWGDVAVDDPQDPKIIRLYLKQSKTDQIGQGAHIVLGRTGRDLCPVTAIMGYIAGRGPQPGPFFLTLDGHPLTKPTFVAEIRKILGTLGFAQHQYAGHSFRIGAATSAAVAGVEDSMIQVLGRWQSAAFLRYIRTPQDRLAALSPVLARQGQNQDGAVTTPQRQ